MEHPIPSRILVFGGTGYIGKYLVQASVSMAHPTLVYARPSSPLTPPANLKLRDRFRSIGVTIIEGTLEEHEKLVSTMKVVDVVISALPYPKVLDQLKIIDAIVVAGNIKRFVPSDFGCEEDRISALPPFEAVLEKKRKVRRAVEEAGIPFTYISGNCCGAYFVNLLLHPHEKSRDDVVVYGTGEAKAVFNHEEDVAQSTIRAAVDPRARNRLVVCRPLKNAISQLDLLSLWEKKTGRSFEKRFLPDEELVRLSNTLPDPENIPVSILHAIFVRGGTVGFELGKDDIEASEFYPDLKFATVDDILEVFLRPGAPEPYRGNFK
ncbi:hypothetical protein MLD38_003821 [Melastoma candidum]|uniref:Uncharacterized protein n=1 Tax=Melastoma candidum TaxID=119954 RepID=A0ACB9S3G2_9MYRT|nr:hypothetical protein MLD38_003821 [Melastoma candidum]